MRVSVQKRANWRAFSPSGWSFTREVLRHAPLTSLLRARWRDEHPTLLLYAALALE
jgi:hypothetical protein